MPMTELDIIILREHLDDHTVELGSIPPDTLPYDRHRETLLHLIATFGENVALQQVLPDYCEHCEYGGQD